MLLYHGSNTDIKEIDLSMCRPYKDFGKGITAISHLRIILILNVISIINTILLLDRLQMMTWLFFSGNMKTA